MKKKEDARLAVLRKYDRSAKDHPNDAKKMGGFVFFGYEKKERPDLSRFPCRRQQMANRSWLASSRRSIERLTPGLLFLGTFSVRKLSKAELREQAAAAFLAWREGQKAKDA